MLQLFLKGCFITSFWPDERMDNHMIELRPKLDYKYSFITFSKNQNLLITTEDIANKVFLTYLCPNGQTDGHVKFNENIF